MDLNPWAPAVSIAADIAAGRIRSRDVLECYLDRCAASMLGAVVTLDAAGARTAADACDRAVADDAALGPLHGVPMTVKDAWAVRGMRSTSGMAELADDVPAHDAVAVARLRAAGAVLFGKTTSRQASPARRRRTRCSAGPSTRGTARVPAAARRAERRRRWRPD